jgi:hypothetical protein
MINCHLLRYPKNNWVPDSTKPPCALPIVNEPFIYRIVQQLHNLEITNISIWTNTNIDIFQDMITKQTRWGVSIHLKIISTQELAVSSIASLDGIKLIGRCDRLPNLSKEEIKKHIVSNQRVIWKNEQDIPIGWHIESPQIIDSHSTAKSVDTLSVTTPSDFLKSQYKILNGSWPELSIGGSKSGNIYCHRGIKVSKTSKIIGPSVIGPHCQIEAYTKLGPDAVLGHESIVSINTSISNACILPGVIIGPGLNINDAIVGPKWMYNQELNVIVPLPKECAASIVSIPEDHSRYSRWIARLIWVILCPILLIVDTIHLFKCGYPMDGHRIYSRPDGSSLVLYQLHSPMLKFQKFLQYSKLEWLTLLLNIANGDLNWVGLRPRTTREYKEMDQESKRLYARIGPGLFYQSSIDKVEMTEDEINSERWYATNKSAKTDILTILKNLW